MAKSSTAKLTNKEIEEIAIKYLMKKYPKAKRVSGNGYDLKIGKKIVEVKGTTKSNYKQNIFLSRDLEHNASKRKDYWLYRVFNVGKKGKTDYKKFKGSKLQLHPDPRWRVTIKKA